LLKLGDGPAFLKDIELPLNRSYRKTDVQLAGRFRERVDLTIELAKGWQASVMPRAMAPVHRTWGMLQQGVEVRDQTLRFRRDVSVMTNSVAPVDFESLRQAINELKANSNLMVVVGDGS